MPIMSFMTLDITTTTMNYKAEDDYVECDCGSGCDYRDITSLPLYEQDCWGQVEMADHQLEQHACQGHLGYFWGDGYIERPVEKPDPIKVEQELLGAPWQREADVVDVFVKFPKGQQFSQRDRALVTAGAKWALASMERNQKRRLQQLISEIKETWTGNESLSAQCEVRNFNEYLTLSLGRIKAALKGKR